MHWADEWSFGQVKIRVEVLTVGTEWGWLEKKVKVEKWARGGTSQTWHKILSRKRVKTKKGLLKCHRNCRSNSRQKRKHQEQVISEPGPDVTVLVPVTPLTREHSNNMWQGWRQSRSVYHVPFGKQKSLPILHSMNCFFPFLPWGPDPESLTEGGMLLVPYAQPDFPDFIVLV